MRCGLLALENPAPPLASNALLLGRRADRRRELIFPFPRSGRVDDEPTVEAFFAWFDGGIERTAPRAVDDVEAALGVGPRANRPHHLVQVRDVDVFVDHHRNPSEIRPS